MTELKSNLPIPLLFLGDAPDSTTGLGRIGHDLAWLASSMPEFRVGYLGRLAFGRARFPWAQYSFGINEQWGEHRLQEAWDDLSQGQRGIIMTVWDASRLLWFADARETGLEDFLKSDRFVRWGYFMADAAGVDPNTLPGEQAHVVSQYQRVCMASRWAYDLVAPQLGPDIDWLPHPINRDVFQPLDGTAIRSAWGIGNAPLIGCVMANQARKSWPVVMEAIALLKAKWAPYLWVHTDAQQHYWDLLALATEYGIQQRVIFEDTRLSDKEMALRYSACNLTVVISGGEGFCYPVAESLSCGVPAITGVYGAQAELTDWRLRPVTTVIDTLHNVRRAVYRAGDVAEGIAEVLADPPEQKQCVELVEHLDMKKLGICWKKWFRKGLQ